MPKYHRLNIDDAINRTPTSNTPTTSSIRTNTSQSNTSGDEEYEDDKLVWTPNAATPAFSRTPPTTDALGGMSLFDELRQTNANELNMDLDDLTMDIPLLGDAKTNFHANPNFNRNANNNHNNSNNNNNNNYDSDFDGYNYKIKQCQCDQPGFGANLVNKSTKDAKFKILLAISLCGVFMLIEFIGGYIAGSLAIMTDAAHLASDCITFIIGLVAIRMGSRPPDAKMSFGYKRMEVLGATVSIMGIWILTGTLVIVAVQRVVTNDYDLDANAMLIISGIGIIINIVMIFVLHDSIFAGFSSHSHSHSHGHGHSHSHSHSHSHDGSSFDDSSSLNASGFSSLDSASVTRESLKDLAVDQRSLHSHSQGSGCSSLGKEKNLNLRAAMIHVIGDLVQSIGVFLASLLIKFYPKAEFVDPLCTILFSVIVIMTTVQLFVESMGILLDMVPKGFKLNELEYDLVRIDGVKSVHHLNVWSHTSNHRVLMVHLVVDILVDSNKVLAEASQLAAGPKYQIKHSTIQIERLIA